MDLLDIFKALSNRTRLDILKGLKDPERHFPPQDEGDVHTVGVCVSSIRKASDCRSPRCPTIWPPATRGPGRGPRIGQWTYYKRNEANISAFAKLIGKEL